MSRPSCAKGQSAGGKVDYPEGISAAVLFIFCTLLSLVRDFAPLQSITIVSSVRPENAIVTLSALLLPYFEPGIVCMPASRPALELFGRLFG